MPCCGLPIHNRKSGHVCRNSIDNRSIGHRPHWAFLLTTIEVVVSHVYVSTHFAWINKAYLANGTRTQDSVCCFAGWIEQQSMRRGLGHPMLSAVIRYTPVSWSHRSMLFSHPKKGLEDTNIAWVAIENTEVGQRPAQKFHVNTSRSLIWVIHREPRGPQSF